MKQPECVTTGLLILLATIRGNETGAGCMDLSLLRAILQESEAKLEMKNF